MKLNAYLTALRNNTLVNSVVSKFPIVTGILLGGSTIGHIIRMWTERTAAGQSLVSWFMVNLAVWLWTIFFIVKTPKERFAIWSEALGIVTTTVAILTVIYFRYVV